MLSHETSAKRATGFGTGDTTRAIFPGSLAQAALAGSAPRRPEGGKLNPCPANRSVLLRELGAKEIQELGLKAQVLVFGSTFQGANLVFDLVGERW